MDINQVPALDLASETGCCPRFDPGPWDRQTLVFQDKPFVRASNRCLFHVPVGMGKVFARVLGRIQAAGVQGAGYLTLTDDASPWRADHWFAVEGPVPGEENTTLSGTFRTRVFEGPYRMAGRWFAEMARELAAEGIAPKRLLAFYTTCPRCARVYGKNYVVLFAQVS